MQKILSTSRSQCENVIKGVSMCEYLKNDVNWRTARSGYAVALVLIESQYVSDAENIGLCLLTNNYRLGRKLLAVLSEDRVIR